MVAPYRSQCPVASALDVIGDRWSLIVIRLLFAGRRRYGDLSSGPERIASSVLAQRLARLEAEGLIFRRAYQDNPPRHEYWLTRKGADLLPVLQAMAAWADKHIADRWPAPDWFAEGRPEDFYPEPLAPVTPPS